MRTVLEGVFAIIQIARVRGGRPGGIAAARGDLRRQSTISDRAGLRDKVRPDAEIFVMQALSGG